MDTSVNLSVSELITDALNFIRVSNQFTNASGFDITLGVKTLNSIIQEFNAASSLLPFYYTFQFNLVANQQIYYIGTGPLANVVRDYYIDITYMNYYNGTVKYPVEILTDFMALKNAINTNFQTYPNRARWYIEVDSATGNQYTVINLLYVPITNFLFEVRGKPSNVNLLPTDTILSLPLYYQNYLVKEIGRRLCPYYSADLWTPLHEKLYEEAKKIIRGSNKVDLGVNMGQALLSRSNNWTFYLA